jgi:3-oxoacyl-[acyl-carrier-protein] synthase III
MRAQTQAVITGWGHALPCRKISNAEICTMIDTSEDWIIDRCGIHQRGIAGELGQDDHGFRTDTLPDATARMAVAAGSRALSRAGAKGSAVDIVLLCTSTPDRVMPATAASVAGELGITGGALDLNSACAGFVYGLLTASSLLTAGARRVLLISAETMTRLVDWSDRGTCFLFGDGAAAVVLERSHQPAGLISWDAGCDASLQSALHAEHGGHILMQGSTVYRNAVRIAVDSAQRCMTRASIGPADVTWLIPHQANQRMIAAIGCKLGISDDRVLSVIKDIGNTGAASIPLALCCQAERGLADGDLVLFGGFGAGMTWASVLWRWAGRELARDHHTAG